MPNKQKNILRIQLIQLFKTMWNKPNAERCLENGCYEGGDHKDFWGQRCIPGFMRTFYSFTGVTINTFIKKVIELNKCGLHKFSIRVFTSIRNVFLKINGLNYRSKYRAPRRESLFPIHWKTEWSQCTVMSMWTFLLVDNKCNNSIQ